MAKKKNTSRKKASSVKIRGGRSAGSRGGGIARNFGRLGLPLMISGILLACLSVLGFTAYKSATASDFFHVRSIDIRGNQRTSSEDIRRIVATETEKSGVWNADLADVKAKLEKFPFVKTAALSRMLPAGIRVDIVERVPAATVHLKTGDFLVDGEGTILSTAKGEERDFPFALTGWDEAKSEKAMTDNVARLKVYKRMLEEWKQFDLLSRVKSVDLTNPRQPTAIVEDSGRQVTITLAKDDLGKSLKTALEVLSGKGAKVKGVDAEGVYPVIEYLDF
ncbi:MAG: FtsQ-type POTRA domain-containing protein [Acidobacteria bacterium]|nr:FtsQ-type POTRA domain-containing protein [Acidobacteriota bacterium]